MSMLGENSDWVRNVRASAGAAVLRHRIMEKVKLEEVPVSQRAPILKAYLRRAPGARPHFDVSRDAPLAEFEKVAATLSRIPHSRGMNRRQLRLQWPKATTPRSIASPFGDPGSCRGRQLFCR